MLFLIFFSQTGNISHRKKLKKMPLQTGYCRSWKSFDIWCRCSNTVLAGLVPRWPVTGVTGVTGLTSLGAAWELAAGWILSIFHRAGPASTLTLRHWWPPQVADSRHQKGTHQLKWSTRWLRSEAVPTGWPSPTNSARNFQWKNCCPQPHLSEVEGVFWSSAAT